MTNLDKSIDLDPIHKSRNMSRCTSGPDCFGAQERTRLLWLLISAIRNSIE